MIEMFEKYAYWKIFQYFSSNPTKEVYVKGLSDEIDLSLGTCSTVLRDLEKMGILEMREMGQAHFYKLKDDYLTKEMKRFVALFILHQGKLIENLLDIDPQIISIALYGSFATGEFDERSDMDLLIISASKISIDTEDLNRELGYTIVILKMKLEEWIRLKEKDDPFYKEVKKDHIHLYGGRLV